MNTGRQIQEVIRTKLQLLHTQVGFDVLVDPGDYLSMLLTRDGIFEAPETDLVTRIVRTGDTCIDAGCHLGYYSCLSALLVGEKGRVYSFDANPQACVSTRRNLALNGLYSSEVIQAALADKNGTTQFHISTDDQTGLSSLGAIPICKETISVPSLRLETFLDLRHVDRVRLLKIDVEGAEEMVLRGLGHFLADHVIDFILLECFDERLQLLKSSTEQLACILKSAGYAPWEYGSQNATGWSQSTEVRSRGDCNYLFARPGFTERVPDVSLAVALRWTQAQREQTLKNHNDLQYQTDRLKDERDGLKNERDVLKEKMKHLQDDVEWLLDSVKTHEAESGRLASEKGQLQAILEAVENSPSWRMLNKWRKVRNWLAPENSIHRRLYDSVLRNLGGKS